MHLYRMKSSLVTPLVGKNIKFKSHQRYAYGNSLVYTVIPPDHFFTIEEKPQVMV